MEEFCNNSGYRVNLYIGEVASASQSRTGASSSGESSA
jgi:hypothetical protein